MQTKRRSKNKNMSVGYYEGLQEDDFKNVHLIRLTQNEQNFLFKRTLSQI